VRLSFLAHGGAPDVDQEEAKRVMQQSFDANRRRQSAAQEEKPTAWTDRAVYNAAYNVMTNAPTDGSAEGVATIYGRVWVEGRSLTHSSGAGLTVITVVSSQNGVRAQVETPSGTTLAGGSLRYWLQDPVTLKWGVGGVDEPLSTGARRVWGTDQFTTVGAR